MAPLDQWLKIQLYPELDFSVRINGDFFIYNFGLLSCNTQLSKIKQQLSIGLDVLQICQGVGPVQNAVAFHCEVATKVTLLQWINT